jgi:O-antigen/teichoic acid export membrane protein
MKRHMRGSALLLLGRGVGVLLNLAVQVLMVRALAVEEYGAFAFGLSVAVVASHLMGLGLDKGVNRFVPIHEERREYGEMAGVIVLVAGLLLATGVTLVGGLYLASPWLGPLVPSSLAASLLLIMICLAPLQALDNVTIKLLAIFATARTLAIRRHILMPGLRLAAIGALIYFGKDVRFLALAWVAATAAALAVSIAIIVKLLRVRSLLPWFLPGRLHVQARPLLRFSLPLLSADVVTAMRGNLVVLLLGALQAATTVATFRAVLPVARLNLVVFDSFKTLFVPSAARMYARGDMEGIGALYWQASTWILLLTFPVFLAAFALAEPLTVLLFGDRYADSAAVLRWLALGTFVNAVTGFNALSLRVVGRVRALVSIDLLTLAAALGLNLLLIPSFGALGGAMASCGTLIFQNAGAQWVLHRDGIVGRPLPVFLRAAAAAFALTSLIVGVDALTPVGLPTLVLLAVVAAASVFLGTVRELDVDATFPELMRIPGLKLLLASRSAGSHSQRQGDAAD